jgi:murein DD-endopeptidase MepM/ murein hydrolase activator NlpD
MDGANLVGRRRVGSRRPCDGCARRASGALLLAASLCLAALPAAAASSLEVELVQLATADGFAIEGLANVGGYRAMAAAGDLHSRLETLLRDFDHVIVDGDGEGRVVLVVIGRHRRAVVPPPAATAPPIERARPAAAWPESALVVTPDAGPVEHARLSSPFGPRRHPLLGIADFHSGIDLAAAAGTPIHAPAAGVVVEAGWRGAYGRYLRIRHDATFETAYGHLSAYAFGMGVGTRIDRGEVIGYVGATGRVTGAHLHYEVLAGGVAIDPQGPAVASLPPEIRPAAVEADLRRALLLAVVGHRIDAVLDRGLGAAEQAVGQ